MKKILFALLAIALLTLVVGCAKKEVAPVVTEPKPAPEPVVAPVEENVVEPVINEPATQVETVLDNPFMGAICQEDNTIKVTITNINEEDWVLGENAKLYLNAGIDEEPGCDKTTLKPGESMTCNKIDWPKVVPSPRENQVQLVVSGIRYTVRGIYCGTA